MREEGEKLFVEEGLLRFVCLKVFRAPRAKQFLNRFGSSSSPPFSLSAPIVVIMKFSIFLALDLALVAPTAALDTYSNHKHHLNALIDTQDVRFLGTHERVPAHSACEEEEGVECPCMTLPCEYESPLDVVIEPDGGLVAWLEGQDWRQFTSRVGMPGARGEGGISIDWVKVTGNGDKGAMIVVPGQSEPCSKYDENMYGIMQEGYSPIYCIDHRGQGRSGRMLEEALKGHVEDGGDFIEDFTDFVKNVITDINADNDLKAADEQEDRVSRLPPRR